jgi:hypothetical protein
MKLYKLTTRNDQTYNKCQWGPDVTVETDGTGDLCGSGFTHWYTHPLLAVLLNPIHGNFDLESAHLWEGEGDIIANDHGLKVGCKKATTLKQIPLPKVTPEQKTRFAILCALEVYQEETFVTWANNWLNDVDKSIATAYAVARAARAAARAVAQAAARAAAEAAAEAANAAAAEAAAEAANAAANAATVRPAAWAAEAAAQAAIWATNAANINLITLAERAING